MLTINWPSGATAASLKRPKSESVKDVMTAVKRQVVVKGCQLRLLLHEAALDDAADLRDLPLSVPLTVVAMDTKDLAAARNAARNGRAREGPARDDLGLEDIRSGWG